MWDTIKRNWITFLGGFFVFMAILYFFKLAFDQGWIPPTARVAIGLLLGATGLFYGYTLYLQEKKLSSEILSGLAGSIIFATFAYASFSDHILWSANTLAISMISFTALITVISYRFEMRMLIFISILGGLLTPLILKAHFDQVFLLFIYVLTLNVVALYLSASKNWPELRVMSFLVTVFIYCTYYIYFEPELWTKPFFYITTFFLVYLAGLILASWQDENKFNGMNLYLGLVNAINFVFWSIYIFKSFTIPYAFPTLFVGVVFLTTSFVIHRLSKEAIIPAAAYFGLGIIIVAIASADLGVHFSTGGMHYVLNAFIWLALTSVVFGLGHRTKLPLAVNLSMGAWLIILVYWFSVAWEVEWVTWLGFKYIPFFNPGALVWIGLAVLGFTFSKVMDQAASLEQSKEVKQNKEKASLTIALLSHAVLGGLLTVQVQNLWDAYAITTVRLSLVLSVVWMVYALSLFLWGAYSQQNIFRWVGSMVLVFTSLK
ncbi:MAG: DUF2339 domain-containing protein, partial [Cyclobacteriaceae bacterium]